MLLFAFIQWLWQNLIEKHCFKYTKSYDECQESLEYEGDGESESFT